MNRYSNSGSFVGSRPYVKNSLPSVFQTSHPAVSGGGGGGGNGISVNAAHAQVRCRLRWADCGCRFPIPLLQDLSPTSPDVKSRAPTRDRRRKALEFGVKIAFRCLDSALALRY